MTQWLAITEKRRRRFAMKSAVEQSASAATARKRGIWPALGLFFLAPIVAEFLLGNMPISMLGLLAILAPMYGGGALLIREAVRRMGRGWPSILVLGLAYGILEEAFLDQTLFNPDFLSLHLHLLDPAYISSLGIGAWWTIFVLTLHTVWSISVSIALAEALVPDRADTPWLGNIGLVIVAVLFALACTAMTLNSIRRDAHHFVASSSQFTWSAIACLVLIAIALSLPRHDRGRAAGTVPSPWLLGIAAFISGMIFLFVPQRWAWSAVCIYLLLDMLWIVAILRWSARRAWTGLCPMALAAGAAMSYGTHAFFETPAVGGAVNTVTRTGNAVFACLALAVIVIGARRTARFKDAE
jgi:hypothetical protein